VGTCGWARSTGESDESGYPIFSIVSLGGTCCVASESKESDSSESESEASSVASSAVSSEASGSDKSTAIVPARWSPTGYTGLHVVEAPGVPFVDLLAALIPQADTTLTIDPRFREVCAAGTIRVCGCVPDQPVAVGAAVTGEVIQIRFAEQRPEQAIHLTLQLWGSRRGFAEWRFPDRTKRQFEQNEAFIRSAYERDA